MYPLENSKPSFVPMDIVKILATGELSVITEVSCNISQTADEHQWSWALDPLDKKSDSRNAWYYASELELVNNIFEIMSERMQHPFSTSPYKFKVERREGK